MSSLPFFNHVKTFSGYHYDRSRPDDDLIFKKKFSGNWAEELTRFTPPTLRTSPDLENKYTRLQIQEWMELGWNMNTHNGKNPLDERFPTLQKIDSYFDFDEKQSYLTQQNPFEMLPYHHDVLGSNNIPIEDVLDRGWRFLVFLTDWEPGQFIIYGNTTIDKWEAGYILGWPAVKYPHGTANVSHYTAYRLRINGLITQNIIDFVNCNKVIDI